MLKADGSGDTPCENFLKSLLGHWETRGDDAKGKYPTIDSFQYGQSSTFFRVKEQTKSFFIHTDLMSWPKGMEGKKGMHYDSGFMRCVSPTSIHWGLAHNFAGGESLVGEVQPNGISAVFKSTNLGNMEEVTATERKLTVYKDQLQDEFSMATKSVPKMTPHLRAFLFKDEDAEM